MLSGVDKGMTADLEHALKTFVEKRDIVVPFLTPENISKLKALDLNILFDYTAILAAGRESKYIHKEYKVFLIQLAYQLGFLYKELFPNKFMGNVMMKKMSQIRTKDLQLETKVLDSFVKEAIKQVKIPIVNTEESDRVYPWNPAVIELFLQDLVNLGNLYSKTFDQLAK
ncbi:MAG: hypothetical protein ACQEXB_23880 [Bacillota bacterium]